MAESLLQNFNHLKIHTQYSICEGALKINELAEKTGSRVIPADATSIDDLNNSYIYTNLKQLILEDDIAKDFLITK